MKDNVEELKNNQEESLGELRKRVNLREMPNDLRNFIASRLPDHVSISEVEKISERIAAILMTYWEEAYPTKQSKS